MDSSKSSGLNIFQCHVSQGFFGNSGSILLGRPNFKTDPRCHRAGIMLVTCEYRRMVLHVVLSEIVEDVWAHSLWLLNMGNTGIPGQWGYAWVCYFRTNPFCVYVSFENPQYGTCSLIWPATAFHYQCHGTMPRNLKEWRQRNWFPNRRWCQAVKFRWRHVLNLKPPFCPASRTVGRLWYCELQKHRSHMKKNHLAVQHRNSSLSKCLIEVKW